MLFRDKELLHHAGDYLGHGLALVVLVIEVVVYEYNILIILKFSYEMIDDLGSNSR